MIRKIAVAFALAVAVAAAPAQTVSQLDFGKGPAQWIMTSEEQRAWRAVRTEEQARDFVDLFWARRDPTPGTPLNEFRLDFEQRVAFADKTFLEPGRRGALTDRGRTLAVLGFPKEMQGDAARVSGATGTDIGTPAVSNVNPKGGGAEAYAGILTGGRALAAREVWTYTHEQAQKFGMPKIEVVYIHDEVKGRMRRDPLRTDFTSALPGAIKSYIVSPDLTQVPEWASSRTEKTIVVPAQAIVTETVSTTKMTRTVVDRPAPVAKAAGAGKLTLLHDISKIQPQSGVDPFASLQNTSSFAKGEELGWASEYCAGVVSAEPPTVKVQLRVNGTASGRPVSMSSEPEEFVPDSIKASPGCYVVRGSLPLADVEPGSYTLTVTVTGPGGEQRYNLTREFRVE